ncbi:DUF3040 domain-containing protein [Lentzea sp. NPDC042327]|uniref:DUF3040 domain-containing protein n=1 Tax=Lentzea sp. NPDC042327 TaxID=3154801 RepID=UPI0033C34A0D
MELPEKERLQLKEIERQLAEEDPRFAARLTRKPPPHQRLSRKAMFAVLLVLADVVGLAVLVGGVTLGSVVLIVLGVAVLAVFPVLVVVRAWQGTRGKR